MMSGLNQIKLSAIIFCACLVTITTYFHANFEWKEEQIKSVEIFVDEPGQLISTIIYVARKSDLDFNFNTVHPSVVVLPDSSLSFDLRENENLRKIRLCFENVGRDLYINKVVFNYESISESKAFNYFKLNEELSQVNQEEPMNRLNLRSQNGYIETPKSYIYPSDLMMIIGGGITMILVSLIFSYYFPKVLIGSVNQILSLQEISVILFISSIFLPHPIFNITLIISVLLLIKNFRFSDFISNKINLLFIAFFLLLLFNDLFISSSGYHNLKATERNLPLLILPIYISCIKEVKVLKYFPISAVIIGLGLFLTSLIDVFVFQNISYLSFEEFAKYIHPVYYSYLLSFSIFYVLLVIDIEKHYKNVVQLILFFFLILSGSKLIITLTLIVYAALFIKNKRVIIIMLLGVVFLALFPPVQDRFKEIINLKDLSIVNEKVITDNNDPRVNGLTLRLLLWQETINTIQTVPEYFFGLGVDDASNETLKVNMTKRGLDKYKKYSTHNQFINLFMRTGFIGLGLLLLIVGYIFYQAIINKNKMLLIMIVMFTFAMLTESVLQRVLGIYFFTTVLLFLMKSNLLNENSDYWN